MSSRNLAQQSWQLAPWRQGLCDHGRHEGAGVPANKCRTSAVRCPWLRGPQDVGRCVKFSSVAGGVSCDRPTRPTSPLLEQARGVNERLRLPWQWRRTWLVDDCDLRACRPDWALDDLDHANRRRSACIAQSPDSGRPDRRAWRDRLPARRMTPNHGPARVACLEQRTTGVVRGHWWGPHPALDLPSDQGKPWPDPSAAQPTRAASQAKNATSILVTNCIRTVTLSGTSPGDGSERSWPLNYPPRLDYTSQGISLGHSRRCVRTSIRMMRGSCIESISLAGGW